MTNNQAAALLEAAGPLAREALAAEFAPHGCVTHSEFTPPALTILADGRVHASMSCTACGSTKHTVVDPLGFAVAEDVTADGTDEE